jgi:hypothetical protein
MPPQQPAVSVASKKSFFFLLANFECVRPVGKIQEIREDWHQPDFSISCFF